MPYDLGYLLGCSWRVIAAISYFLCRLFYMRTGIIGPHVALSLMQVFLPERGFERFLMMLEIFLLEYNVTLSQFFL